MAEEKSFIEAAKESFKIVRAIALFFKLPRLSEICFIISAVIYLLGAIYFLNVPGVRQTKTLYNDTISHVYMLQIFERDGVSSEGIPLPSPAIEDELFERPASAASTIRISVQDIDDKHRILILNKQ